MTWVSEDHLHTYTYHSGHKHESSTWSSEKIHVLTQNNCHCTHLFCTNVVLVLMTRMINPKIRSFLPFSCCWHVDQSGPFCMLLSPSAYLYPVKISTSLAFTKLTNYSLTCNQTTKHVFLIQWGKTGGCKHLRFQHLNRRAKLLPEMFPGSWGIIAAVYVRTSPLCIWQSILNYAP